MRYLFLLYVEDRPEPATPEGVRYYGALREWQRECRARGAFVAANPLERPDTAATVRVRDGRLLRTDGPFAETTEWLGGYFLLDCLDREQALELARVCPVAAEGSVEVRPLAQ
jgi:hypothetical protein